MGFYLDNWEYSENCRPGMKPKNYDPLKEVLEIEDITRDNFFAQAIIEQSRLVFCFQGSNDWKDWYNDLSIDKTREDGTIHVGFYDGWQRFKSRINEIIYDYTAKNPEPDIQLRGHSLGAALATLCERHIAKNLGLRCRGIVYGCPLWCNERGAREFELLPCDHTRVENAHDLICAVPPEKLGWHRVGKCVTIPHKWWQNLPPWNCCDHVDYKKALKRYNM